MREGERGLNWHTESSPVKGNRGRAFNSGSRMHQLYLPFDLFVVEILISPVASACGPERMKLFSVSEMAKLAIFELWLCSHCHVQAIETMH